MAEIKSAWPKACGFYFNRSNISIIEFY